jgi:hypothetical protein
VTFETWEFTSESCFKVSASTISAFAFTPFGLCFISNVFVMWAFCFLTYSLSKLFDSFLSEIWMPQLVAVKLDDVSKDNIVGTPSIVSWTGNKESHICSTTLSKASAISWGRLVEEYKTQGRP